MTKSGTRMTTQGKRKTLIRRWGLSEAEQIGDIENEGACHLPMADDQSVSNTGTSASPTAKQCIKLTKRMNGKKRVIREVRLTMYVVVGQGG